MENNSYQMIKDFIFNKLQSIEDILPENKIEEEIKNTRDLMETLGPDLFAKVLSAEKLVPISEEDWKRMKREFEAHFDVEMAGGILVQGTEQQSRDTTWWTSKEKQNNENYYWQRYKKYMKKSLPPEVTKTTDDDTDIVMDNIENPAIDSFSRYGMVVGHVQSGKTSNYAALVCKAADAGYKFIVVVAGGMNNLRNQTQERMNEAFVGKDAKGPTGVGKQSGIDKSRLPISLTTAEQDFNRQDANRNSQGLNFDNISSPVILVIKKNSNTLNNVIKWLKAQYKNQIANHAMLLIDDESDYASINTKDEEDPTIINERIRKLLDLFQKSAYVAYTATPYANIFIDHEAENEEVGKDLFPQDFIYALDAPNNYFGARKIFIDTDDKHIVHIDDYLEDIPPKHKKDFPLSGLPESLHDAVRLFIINIGIRNLRGQAGKHNSMLIHASRFTGMHQKTSMHIENYLGNVKEHISIYGKSSKGSKVLKDFETTFRNHYPESEFKWEKVRSSICDIIETVIIREVHAKTKIPLEYRNDQATNAIVVGGTSLSRGFTLEGLTISYFLRNTVFYDTLMQMGRWFGYRPGYEDLCRIYMPPSIAGNFKIIIEATEDLINDLKIMAKNNMTPKDFGLSVKHHPDSALQITARNKQKSSKDIYLEMKLDGHLKETSWLPSDKIVNKKNLEAISEVITFMETNKVKYEEKGNAYLWRNIEKHIINDFLNKFQVYKLDQHGLSSRMPIGFIKEYVQDVDTKWDIALYSGDSKEPFQIKTVKVRRQERTLTEKGNYYEVAQRQVSSGNAESIVLSAKEKLVAGNKRKEIRRIMNKPLLMLHVLDDKNGNAFAAFGVSFPGGVTTKNKTVKLKINSVYAQNMLSGLMNEDEDDFDD